MVDDSIRIGAAIVMRTSDKMGFVVFMNGDAIDVNPIYMIEDELIAWAENH